MVELFLKASLVAGTLITLVTEGLNLFDAINPLAAKYVWASVLLALAVICLKFRGQLILVYSSVTQGVKSFLRLSRLEMFLFIGTLTIVAGVGLTAIVAAPNTADSMVYHMTRIAHWIQNGSLRPYATMCTRQLHQCPYVEYAILQLQLLSSGDRFANLVQWFSFIGSILGISLVTKRLGGSRRAQIISSALVATLPMAILQGSSTQNDLTGTLWMITFVNFFLAYKEKPTLKNVFYMGLSLGLAILTKQTAYVYAFPFLLWTGFLMLRNHGIKNLWKPVIVLSITACLLNGGFWKRNYDFLGSFLGLEHAIAVDNTPDTFNNEAFTGAIFASNVVRNLSVHWGTPFPAVNTLLERGIYRFHDVIGLSVDDRRNNATFREHYRFEGLSTNEDLAGNPLHFILITVFLTAACLRFFSRKDHPHLLYLICLAVGFLLFCAMVKWVPYHSRLHLAFFALILGWVAIQMDRLLRPVFLFGILALLIAASFYWVGRNEFRPLVGKDSVLRTSRADQYFNNRPWLRTSFKAVANLIRRNNFRRVGLITRDSDFEYPLWALLDANNTGIRIEQLDVQNISAKAADPSFIPQIVICTGFQNRVDQDKLAEYTARYGPLRLAGALYLFTKERT